MFLSLEVLFLWHFILKLNTVEIRPLIELNYVLDRPDGINGVIAVIFCHLGVLCMFMLYFIPGRTMRISSTPD